MGTPPGTATGATAAKVVLLVVAGLVLVATLLTGLVLLVGQKGRNEAARRAAGATDDHYESVDGSFRVVTGRAPRTTSIPVPLPDGSTATAVDYLFETSPTSGIVVHVVPVGDVATDGLADQALSRLVDRGLDLGHTATTTFAGHDAVAFEGRWNRGDGEYAVEGYAIAPPGRVLVVMDNELTGTTPAGVDAFERFVATFEVGPMP